MEGLIFGGAYLWREIYVSKLIGRFNGGFFALRVWGAYIWRGLYMEGLIFVILRYLNEDMIFAVVIAIKAIANQPEKKISGLQRDSNPWPLR